MSIKLNGFNSKVVTFKASGDIVLGTPVRPSSNYTVSPCPASSPFVGVAVSLSNGLVGVQTNGYFELPYSSSTPSIGFARMAADGKGGLLLDSTNGRECAVVYVNTATKTVGILM